MEQTNGIATSHFATQEASAKGRITLDLSRKKSVPAKTLRDPGLPDAVGLYDPALEKDSCGVGFVADMKRGKSHDVIEMGLKILLNLLLVL